jgi:V/A-type H+-transporting ATPase subunit E
MAEELQSLLERIQQDGIEKAETKAEAIITEAKTKAAAILSDAQKEADAIIAKAEEDGKVFEQRGVSAISQTARDVILSVSDAVSATLRKIVDQSVKSSLSKEDFPAIVKNAVTTYCRNTNAENIEVIVSDDQREAVTNYFLKEMADQMKSGLTIKGEHSIISGFIVSLKEDGVHHDFTGKTLTDVFANLLRPQLAEIVKSATTKN